MIIVLSITIQEINLKLKKTSLAVIILDIILEIQCSFVREIRRNSITQRYAAENQLRLFLRSLNTY